MAVSMFRNGKWHFKAAVEPTVRRWRVVSADGRTEMPFHLEEQARRYAEKHGGRVEERVARPFKLQEAR